MKVRQAEPVDSARGGERVGRRRDLLELGVGYGLILLVIWSPRPWQRELYWAAVVFLVAALWTSFDSWSAMGLRTANFWRSFWVVGVALGMAAIAIVVARHAGVMKPAGGPNAFFKRYWGYALWSLAQQILLMDFFLRKFLHLIASPGKAVLVTAGVFAAAHLPNPVLTVVTFVLGAAACLVFLRYRNLWPLAIAHAILGITIALTVPGPVIHNMRVGLGYLTYRPHRVHQSRELHERHGRHQRSQMDHTVSMKVWVIAEAPTRRS